MPSPVQSQAIIDACLHWPDRLFMSTRTPISPAIRITMIDAIEDLLPQTQCGKCKHPGCRPYAEGIAAGEAINHCVPGGQATINALADLLGEIPMQLNPDYGVTPAQRQVAFIREEECIGCTKCVQACPVDAIVGAAKFTFTVIVDECTGCDLCIAPCPVDCIDLVDLDQPLLTDPVERKPKADKLKGRYLFRNARLATEKALRKPLRETPSNEDPSDTAAMPQASIHENPPAGIAPANDKARVIAAALARSNLKKAERRLAAARDNGEDTSLIEQEITSIQRQLQELQAT